MEYNLCQDKSAICSEDKYGPVSLLYSNPVNRGSLEITVAGLSFPPLVDQFNVFPKVLSFSWIFFIKFPVQDASKLKTNN